MIDRLIFRFMMRITIIAITMLIPKRDHRLFKMSTMTQLIFQLMLKDKEHYLQDR